MTEKTDKIVAGVIANHLGRDQAEVTAEKSIIDDLGADSLDTVELVMAMEGEFGIEITDEAAEGLLTVGDFFRLVDKALKEKSV